MFKMAHIEIGGPQRLRLLGLEALAEIREAA